MESIDTSILTAYSDMQFIKGFSSFINDEQIRTEMETKLNKLDDLLSFLVEGIESDLKKFKPHQKIRDLLDGKKVIFKEEDEDPLRYYTFITVNSIISKGVTFYSIGERNKTLKNNLSFAPWVKEMLQVGGNYIIHNDVKAPAKYHWNWAEAIAPESNLNNPVLNAKVRLLASFFQKMKKQRI